MSNTIKNLFIWLLFIILGFSLGVVYSNIIKGTKDKVVVVPPQTNEQKAEITPEKDLVTFTSTNLGVSFQYPKSEGQDININENGNKIKMSSSQGAGYGEFEVIFKDKNETIEDAIAKLEPQLKQNPYCFLNQDYIGADKPYAYYLGYPYAYLLQNVAGDIPIGNVVKKFDDKESCYSTWYYIYDYSVPDRFVKASHSTQSVEYYPIIYNQENNGNGIKWIETLKFISK